MSVSSPRAETTPPETTPLHNDIRSLVSDRTDLLRDRAGTYNEVQATVGEEGVTLLLSHSVSLDDAAVVFVPKDRILFMDNEEDQPLLDNLNHPEGRWDDAPDNYRRVEGT
jgi:hypothetical protein